MIKPQNFFQDLPDALEAESIEVLARPGGGRIERIVSRGQASPRGFWYEQAEDEWVILLAGGARLGFDDGRAPLELAVGDCLLIPAGVRHRVEWTSTDPPALWLAVFAQGPTPGRSN